MDQNQLKKEAAKEAIKYIPENSIVGVGTGSTVDFFIEELGKIKDKIKGTVVSSKRSEEKLKSLGIEVIDSNSVDEIPVYVDGADEINDNLQMIKGGGAALTGEKIIAAISKKFICIAGENKKVKVLGNFPLPVEVIPLARSYVAREIVKLGGFPIYREGVKTDYGNVILDVANLEILKPKELEKTLNNISGVVTNGLFALRPADTLILAANDGVYVTESNH